MINVKVAIEASQKANRDNWVKASLERLGDEILKVAKTGKREFTISLDDLIIGAESLFECGEMLANVDKFITDEGFKHIVKPNGTLIISW